MRSVTGAALLCSVAASLSTAFAAPALVAPLSTSEITQLASEFSDFFLNEGYSGLWQQIDGCYKTAASLGDTKILSNCIILDEAGKALDDNHVKATGGAYHNREWYEDSAFNDRMTKYSAAAFDDSNAYRDFWEQNKVGFGTALRKLNLSGLTDPRRFP